MKKLIYLFFVAALLPIAVMGQSVEKKKLAVYVTGDGVSENVKKVVGSKMVEWFTKSKIYSAAERSADFIRQLAKEYDYQMSGAVDEADIVSVGKHLGVEYVAVADLTEMYGEMYVDARLINVQTGEILVSTSKNSAVSTMPQLIALAEGVAGALSSRADTSAGGTIPAVASSNPDLASGDGLNTFRYDGYDMGGIIKVYDFGVAPCRFKVSWSLCAACTMMVIKDEYGNELGRFGHDDPKGAMSGVTYSAPVGERILTTSTPGISVEVLNVGSHRAFYEITPL